MRSSRSGSGDAQRGFDSQRVKLSSAGLRAKPQCLALGYSTTAIGGLVARTSPREEPSSSIMP